MDTITVRVIPLDNGHSWLDCSECGPLGTSPTTTSRTDARQHLADHGITEEP